MRDDLRRSRRYRELFGNLFRRDLQAKYKGSVLGVLWVLIPPLVLMGVYLLVFRSSGGPRTIPHYPLYLLAGLALLDLLLDVAPGRRARDGRQRRS